MENFPLNFALTDLKRTLLRNFYIFNYYLCYGTPSHTRDFCLNVGYFGFFFQIEIIFSININYNRLHAYCRSRLRQQRRQNN